MDALIPIVFEAAVKESSKQLVSADFAELAVKAGAVISASLFGGLAGTNALPFSREQFENAIRHGGIGIDASLRAFALGYEAAANGKQTSPAAEEEQDLRVGPSLLGIAEQIQSEWPAETHTILFPAIRRLAEYQDVQYAVEFLARLSPVLAIDRQYGDGSFRLTQETARYLALWSTYEDAARVADLKIRSSRFDRVQRDNHLRPTQLVQIDEFLSPQPQEIADLLPVKLGQWLMRSASMQRLIKRFYRGWEGLTQQFADRLSHAFYAFRAARDAARLVAFSC